MRQGSSGTAVRAVQFYLRRLAAYYSDVPTVTVDGTFGEATTRAVRAWQERAGLTVDGTVGRLTWQSIYDAVQALETSGPVVRVVGLTSPTGTLRPGDSGPEVLQLNRLLLFLNQWIPEINFLAGTEPSGTFDPALEIAVRSAQRYFGLAETGEVTPATWTIFRDAALTLLAVTPAAAGPEPDGEWPASALALGRGSTSSPPWTRGQTLSPRPAYLTKLRNRRWKATSSPPACSPWAWWTPTHGKACAWPPRAFAASAGTRRDNYGKTVRVRCLQQPLLHL